MYNKINYDYQRWLNKVAGKEESRELFELERIDYGKFKWNIGEYSIRSMASIDGLRLLIITGKHIIRSIIWLEIKEMGI